MNIHDIMLKVGQYRSADTAQAEKLLAEIRTALIDAASEYLERYRDSQILGVMECAAGDINNIDYYDHVNDAEIEAAVSLEWSRITSPATAA